jgi:hypothetical protein
MRVHAFPDVKKFLKKGLTNGQPFCILIKVMVTIKDIL